jgi:hypothetical protein
VSSAKVRGAARGIDAETRTSSAAPSAARSLDARSIAAGGMLLVSAGPVGLGGDLRGPTGWVGLGEFWRSSWGHAVSPSRASATRGSCAQKLGAFGGDAPWNGRGKPRVEGVRPAGGPL